MKQIKKWFGEHGIYIAWAIALLSFAGSVYFAEFRGIPRCALCWWQDIFMYPLVIIIGTGVLRKDRSIAVYTLPMSIIGTMIALYQNLLIWNVISESFAPCTLGVSCVIQTWIALNFITLPLLSLIAFTLITLLMVFHHRANSHD